MAPFKYVMVLMAVTAVLPLFAGSLPDATVSCQDSSHVDSGGVLHIDSSAARQEFGWRR